MTVVSHCVWCKNRFASTVPELCDDLRKAIEEGDEHNALIMAFAAELALFQESWPYCSRRCESEDMDYPEGHPDREGLESTLRSIDSLPWKYIQAKAQGIEIPERPPPPKLVGLGPDDVPPEEMANPLLSQAEPEAPNLRLVESLEAAETEAQELVKQRQKQVRASFRASEKKTNGWRTASKFFAGVFLSSTVVQGLGLVLDDDTLIQTGIGLMLVAIVGGGTALVGSRASRT